MRNNITRSLMIAGCCVLLAGFLGCGGTAAGPSSLDEATALLQSSLTAWKEGKTLDDMRSQQPPVYVAEDLWYSGQTLLGFKIAEPGEVVGTNVRFHVILSIKGKSDAKESEKKVKYMVATNPALSIARED